jgi:signal transduction histidine kinase
MDPKESILIVDDDASICATLARILVRKGYETDTAATGRKALEKIRGRSFNLTLLDIRLPDVVGMDLLRRLRESQPDMAVILVTAYASIQTATQALKEGAAAYIIKPVDTDEMLAAIRQALDKRRLVLENRRLYQETRRELGQRKRAEEALRQTAATLERFSHLLLALARVGLQAQESLAVDEILVMTSNEVKELGFESATLMREGENLVLRHTSIEGARREAVEELCGAKMIGFAASLEDPILRAPVKTRKTVFVAEPARALSRVLPATIFGELERVLRILHVGQAILAPLIARDRLIGLLVLWSPDLGQDDVPALTALANQMAVAIENARLLRKLREQSKQLRAFAARLADVEEASRQQLARELHDQVGQNLTALGIDLSVVRAHMLKDTPEAVRARLDDALGLVELTSEGIRDVMGNLRPPLLDDFGLPAALHWLAEQFRLRAGVGVTVRCEELEPRLQPRVENALYRIAQEALTNVSKHARATQVTVSLATIDSTVRLVIADDGVGFEPSHSAGLLGRQGWGLVTMTERAEGVGGHCRVESRPGQGARIVVEVAR